MSKNQAELLTSRLKEWNLTYLGLRTSYFRKRNEDLVTYFTDVNNLTYCSNIEGFFSVFDMEHNYVNWRLFIDSSKRSLKAVLPEHSVHLKGTYERMVILLNALNYNNYKW